MSKSAILKSSIARKWWMALTGLFLCLFLVGHLLGNLQLIFIEGIEGKRAFNEYAYFMTHNPLIKIMSYLTYFSILFHAVFGIYITIKNKKARPINYAYNKPGENSALPSRYMAILGSAILVFIVLHMSAFWGRMHFGEVPLHTVTSIDEKSGDTSDYYLTLSNDFVPKAAFDIPEGAEKAPFSIVDGSKLINNSAGLEIGEGYKDLHSMTLAYFGHDKSKEGFIANKYALVAMILYVLAMIVMAFHLWHGFASAFQSLGLKNKKYTPLISGFGKAFSILVPLAFAIIPIIIFLTK